MSMYSFAYREQSAQLNATDQFAIALRCLVFVFLVAPLCGHARAPVPVPTIDSRSFILMDHMSGQILAENNADERVDPASITKVMTVYVAAHALRAGLVSLTDQVLISEKAWRMEGSRMFIEVGKQVSVDDLLNGVIVQSGNDASVALAEHVSGSEDLFAAVMNDHARQLGMLNSSFANATGLPDPNTYVTARDIALLSSALIREFPDIYARFALNEFVFNDIRQPNRNRLLSRDPTVDGIKNGHTESAGYCLASSAFRDGTRLIAAVMGTKSDRARTEASHTLLNYGYRFFETKHLYKLDDVVTTAKVWRGAEQALDIGPAHDVYVSIPRGSYDDLKAAAKLDNPIVAPIVKGQLLGHIVVELDGEEIAQVPLIARQAVALGAFVSRTIDDVMLLFE